MAIVLKTICGRTHAGSNPALSSRNGLNGVKNSSDIMVTSIRSCKTKFEKGSIVESKVLIILRRI